MTADDAAAALPAWDFAAAILSADQAGRDHAVAAMMETPITSITALGTVLLVIARDDALEVVHRQVALSQLRAVMPPTTDPAP